jgi:predicted ATPase with chaperone activity
LDLKRLRSNNLRWTGADHAIGSIRFHPLEDGKVTISRAAGSVTFPSEFMLVAAMNPCPCGYFGDLKRECRCGSIQVQRYRQRISGPLLDRIDLHIEVPAVEYRESRARVRRKIRRRSEIVLAVRARDSGRAFNRTRRSIAMRGWGRGKSSSTANLAKIHRN